jgi:FixJ family two-component response regulator
MSATGGKRTLACLSRRDDHPAQGDPSHSDPFHLKRGLSSRLANQVPARKCLAHKVSLPLADYGHKGAGRFAIILLIRRTHPLDTSALFDRRAYIVDDNEPFRTMVRRTLTNSGIHCEEFKSAEHLLQGYGDRAAGCILLDVRLPGMSGVELLKRLKLAHPPNPIIMMSGHADIPMAVEAVKSGALDFIQKPFQKEVLLRLVDAAFEILKSQQSSPASRIGLLTSREKEILAAFAGGAPNKIVADRFQISQRTVEMHRANIIRKLQVSNLTQALFLAEERNLL